VHFSFQNEKGQRPEGLSIQETASILRVSKGTVRAQRRNCHGHAQNSCAGSSPDNAEDLPPKLSNPTWDEFWRFGCIMPSKLLRVSISHELRTVDCQRHLVEVRTFPPSVDTMFSSCIPMADPKFLKTLCLMRKLAFGEPRAVGQGSICFPDRRIITGEPNNKKMCSHSVSLQSNKRRRVLRRVVP